MEWQLQLIGDYMAIEKAMQCSSVPRRWRRSAPDFSDVEVISCYLFGLKSGLRSVRKIHRLATDHLIDWFPRLPCYEQFLRRLNRLGSYCREVCKRLFEESESQFENESICIDSAPIVVADQARSCRAKVAKNLCDQGYNASKKRYFYGVKLHLACRSRNSSPYQIFFSEISGASVHDINLLKRTLPDYKSKIIYADKAYASAAITDLAKKSNKVIITPVKKKKGEEMKIEQVAINSLIASTRQSVESAIQWIASKTGIFKASHLRSSKGIIRHIYTALFGLTIEVL